jgi:hypothetical protein
MILTGTGQKPSGQKPPGHKGPGQKPRQKAPNNEIIIQSLNNSLITFNNFKDYKCNHQLFINKNNS